MVFKCEGFSIIFDIIWVNVGVLGDVCKKFEMFIIGFIKDLEFFNVVGIKLVVGILFWGFLGCGKIFVVKVVVNEFKVNFIFIKGLELFNKYVGEFEWVVC